MFKFLVDHNIPKSVGVFLKKEKYDVKFVKDINPEMSDLEVIKLARKENRIIVSNDKDFVALSVKHNKVDMILFDLLDQKSEVRILGLKKILSEVKIGFGVIIIQ